MKEKITVLIADAFPYLTYINAVSVTDELFDAIVPFSKGIIESLAAFSKAEPIAVLEYTLVISALALILLYYIMRIF